MTGYCPGGTGPPECYAGTKWTPNDPMFFLHHGVRVISAIGLTAFPLSYRTVAQMVDKIWYDWQQKSTKNKYAFGGGSVTATRNYTTFRQFPTGLPPYLSVSPSFDVKRIMVSDPLRSPPSQFDSKLEGDGLWNVTIWDVMDTMGRYALLRICLGVGGHLTLPQPVDAIPFAVEASPGYSPGRRGHSMSIGLFLSHMDFRK
jgi:hypothetical protein